MTQNEKWKEIKSRYLSKEISEEEYYRLCDEECLELTGWIDEEFARDHGFSGDSVELTSFASNEKLKKDRKE